MSPVDLSCWSLFCSRAARCCLSTVECVFVGGSKCRLWTCRVGLLSVVVLLVAVFYSGMCVCWRVQVSSVDLSCWSLVCSRAAHCCLSSVECVFVCLLDDPSVACGPVVLASCL